MDVQSLKKLLRGKNAGLILILVIFGLVMIFIPGLSSGDSKTSPRDTEDDNLEYAKTLEARVKTIVESLDGAGRCEVMITLENGAEQVFAVESRENRTESADSERTSSALDSQRSILTVSSGGEQRPIIVRRIEPKVRGVVIACEGGDDAATALMITDAVRTLFDIPSANICVIKLST
ncbi:MAG: hypothetical protein IIZ19_08765 [Clostridia bacterium]|nr:hypothetical protein [Clostridia bacterium]